MELFIGNYEKVIGTTVFAKRRNKFIPCHVTNYYFKSRKYALVPIEDFLKDAEDRRVYYSQEIYTF